MGTEERKIQFFKEKIMARLEELRDFMPEIKYKLYKTMIDDCDSYDEIREMAELDLQFNMIRYVNELKDKLKNNNTNLEELEAVTNKNVRASKLVVITPKPKSQLTNAEKLADIDLSTLGEDMEDEDVLASAANLLLMRMRTMPPEELYKEELENYEDDIEEDGIEDLDGDELFEDTDDIFDDEDDDELEFEDGALEGLEEELTEKKLDIRDIRNTDDDEDDDDVLDFGDTETKDEDGVDIDDLDSLGDDMFTDDIDDIDEDIEDFDIDSMDDSELFDDSYDDDFEDDSEDFDIDSMDDSDIFVENEDDFEDTEEDDFDIESMDDSDMFGDDDDFEDDSDEEGGDFDIESMDDSDMFGDSEDSFEDEFEDEFEEDGETNIDDIDDSELFEDSDSEDDFDDDDGVDNIDDIEDDSDEFDIDDSDFDTGEPEDDLDDFFSDLNNSTSQSQSSNTVQKRQMAPNKIFLNNTKRGEQTQQMFNFLNGLFGGTAKLATKAGAGAKRAATNGIQRVNNSSYFDLDSNRTRR